VQPVVPRRRPAVRRGARPSGKEKSGASDPTGASCLRECGSGARRPHARNQVEGPTFECRSRVVSSRGPRRHRQKCASGVPIRMDSRPFVRPAPCRPHERGPFACFLPVPGGGVPACAALSGPRPGRSDRFIPRRSAAFCPALGARSAGARKARAVGPGQPAV
jgi:hypothetical protein